LINSLVRGSNASMDLRIGISFSDELDNQDQYTTEGSRLLRMTPVVPSSLLYEPRPGSIRLFLRYAHTIQAGDIIPAVLGTTKYNIDWVVEALPQQHIRGGVFYHGIYQRYNNGIWKVEALPQQHIRGGVFYHGIYQKIQQWNMEFLTCTQNLTLRM
jgi:hypothetical protein